MNGKCLVYSNSIHTVLAHSRQPRLFCAQKAESLNTWRLHFIIFCIRSHSSSMWSYH